MDFIKEEQRFCAQNYHPLPIVLTRGKGAYVWDIHGKKYLDMLSAYSAVSHGHAHPKLLKALTTQAKRLAVPSRAVYHDQLAPFLKMLCQFSNMESALPMNSGAEAVETAIKAARRYAYHVKKIPEGKAEIIVAENNFHGRTTGIISFSSEPAYRDGFSPFLPGFVTVPFGDVNALERAITANTCAFLVEPMQGEAGIRIPPAGWLKEAARICKKHKVLLILDEVQTGLGRTGKWFAYQHEIEAPDGLIVGKALGGGLMPISAFLAKKEVMNMFTPGSHGSTFGGSALASAVGLAALKTMKEEKLVNNSAVLGRYFLRELQKIKSPLITDIRGKGLWVGLEIDTKIPARTLCEKLLERGILSKETHGTVVRFAPPLIITKAQLDYAVRGLREVLAFFNR